MAAARRMVSYWKERKAAFGDERAFLPMNLVSGHGALSPEDVNTLQAGHWLHLPRCDHHHQQNKSRCTVLYHDHSMEPHEDMTTTTAPTTCSFARIIFFMLQIALENEASREQGFVLLLDVSNPFAACFDEAFEETMRGLMSKAMPMKIYHINLICNPPPFNDCNDRKAFVKTSKSFCLLHLILEDPLLIIKNA